MNKHLGTCEDCAIGFYQEQDAQTECTKCPPGTLTTEGRTDNSSNCLGTVFNCSFDISICNIYVSNSVLSSLVFDILFNGENVYTHWMLVKDFI